MRSAKDILVKPIASKLANKVCRAYHYSGKVVPNSNIHFGVFLDGSCLGVLQFGPCMVKRKMMGLVKGTQWDEFIELNRMAFSNELPRFSESRAIGICLKILKKKYPKLKWVLSFSDATQCGDGTIYRASNFKLIGIKRNNSIIKLPDGTITTNMTMGKGKNIIHSGRSSVPKGSVKLEGFQLQYIYFLHPKEIANLTKKVIPFEKIKEVGAKMYLGKKV